MEAPGNGGAAAEFVIRRGRRSENKKIVNLIVGLAKFERLKPPGARAESRLVRDIFERRLARVFVAEVGEKLIGYALYFYTYSTFIAQPTLYLEDIFVEEDWRRSGVGGALFMRCVREARLKGCGRMEWMVLTWNRKAMSFYQKLGAKRLEDLRLYRLDNKNLQRLARVK